MATEARAAPPLSEWGFWWRWVLASALGWSLAGLAALGGQYFASGAVFFASLVAAVPQWLVLRRFLPHASLWLLMTAVGWLAMWFTGYFLFFLGGVVLGFFQWAVFLQAYWARWWVPISGVAWSIGVYLSLLVETNILKTWDPSSPGILMISGALGGIVYGMITTSALTDLVRSDPRKSPT